VREELLGACRAAVTTCGCEDGCPGCVGPQADGSGEGKRAALTMLDRLLAV
jgi:DEAD/DEAH box helicase domain-containing protein